MENSRDQKMYSSRSFTHGRTVCTGETRGLGDELQKLVEAGYTLIEVPSAWEGAISYIILDPDNPTSEAPASLLPDDE